VVFVTRFSILDASARGWVASREAEGDEARLAAVLFDEARLAAKMRCFERVTAPSVAAQEGPVEWWIYTSDRLPAAWRARLSSAVEGCVSRLRAVRVVEVASMGEFTRDVRRRVAELQAASGERFATVRLDDDDGVAASYCRRLRRVAERSGPGDVVTFPRGRRYTFAGEAMRLGEEMCWDLIALGLARLQDNVHDCGDHTKVRERFRVHADEAPGMYLCFCGDASDTKRRFR
jgi:hypothetical protein